MRADFTALTNLSLAPLKSLQADLLQLEFVLSLCGPPVINKPRWFLYVFICICVCVCVCVCVWACEAERNVYLFRTQKQAERCPVVGLGPERFLHSAGFIVLQALSLHSRRMLSVSWFSYWPLSTHTHTHTHAHTHTHTHTHKHTPFMWERMGPVWIRLFPCVTLDKAFNIPCSLCPNSILAQAEWRLENPRAAAEFLVWPTLLL